MLENRVLLSVAPMVASNPRSTRGGHQKPVVQGPRAAPIAIVRRTAKKASTLVPGTAFTPAQIRKAYGFDQISFGGITGDGTGQTIAAPLMLMTIRMRPTDLHQFDLQFGLADPPSFRRVAQDGSTNYPPVDPAGPGAAAGTWEEEESLDIEWAHAVAPAANILLVEATDSSFSQPD